MTLSKERGLKGGMIHGTSMMLFTPLYDLHFLFALSFVFLIYFPPSIAPQLFQFLFFLYIRGWGNFKFFIFLKGVILVCFSEL